MAEIAIADIVAGANMARADSAPRGVRDLADAIRASGWIAPIVVRELGDGSYAVVAGHRRLAAARLLGLESIPAEVVDDAARHHINLAENMRRAVSPIEQGLAWQASLARGLTVSELAALSGVSASQVSRLTSAVRRLHPDVIAHYRDRPVTQAQLIALSWHSAPRQLRAISACRNPQRAPTRRRARRARDIRTQIRELVKLPRGAVRDAQLRALLWVVRDVEDI